MCAVLRHGYNKHLENTKTKQNKKMWICFSQFLKSIHAWKLYVSLLLTAFAQNVQFMRKWREVTKPTQKFVQMGKIGSLDENSYGAKVMWSDQTAPMSSNCTRLRIHSRFEFQVTHSNLTHCLYRFLDGPKIFPKIHASNSTSQAFSV